MPGRYTANIVTITRAGSRDNIIELEWEQGPRIAFSQITSCLGIIGCYRGASIVGVHLPFMDSTNTPVTAVQPQALVSAVSRIVAGCPHIYVIGEISVWKDNAPAHLLALKRAFHAQATTPRGSGLYAAHAADADPFVAITKNGNDVYVIP